MLEAVDHTGVLVTLTVEQRGALGVNLDLQVDELLEVLVELGGFGCHLVGERHTRDLLGEQAPTLTGDLGDLEGLRGADAGLGDAGEVQGLVEDIGSRLVGVEDLGDLVAQVVDLLVGVLDDNGLGLGQIHGVPSFLNGSTPSMDLHHLRTPAPPLAMSWVSGGKRAGSGCAYRTA